MGNPSELKRGELSFRVKLPPELWKRLEAKANGTPLAHYLASLVRQDLERLTQGVIDSSFVVPGRSEQDQGVITLGLAPALWRRRRFEAKGGSAALAEYIGNTIRWHSELVLQRLGLFLGLDGIETRQRDPLIGSFDLGIAVQALSDLPPFGVPTDPVPRLSLWLATAIDSTSDSEIAARRKLDAAFKALLLVVPISCSDIVLCQRGGKVTHERQRYLYTAAGGVEGGIKVGMRELIKVRAVHSGLDLILNSHSLGRLRRGLKAFYHGLQEELLEDRLHQFVRAMEAVTIPFLKTPLSKGKNMSATARFAYRAQVFAGISPRIQDALRRAYEIRSEVEHLQNPYDTSPYSDSSQKSSLYMLTRNMETLCRHTYNRLASSDKHAYFEDQNVEKFWHQEEDLHKQSKRWGEPLKSFLGKPWWDERDHDLRLETVPQGGPTVRSSH
jgi:hypothetical protein